MIIVVNISTVKQGLCVDKLLWSQIAPKMAIAIVRFVEGLGKSLHNHLKVPGQSSESQNYHSCFSTC